MNHPARGAVGVIVSAAGLPGRALPPAYFNNGCNALDRRARTPVAIACRDRVGPSPRRRSEE